MKCLVILLEEPSARAMLQGFLPRVLPETVNVKYVVFEGKQDLEQNMVRKISGWQMPNSEFLILRDQDRADCRVIKEGLLAKCMAAKQPNAVVRIACRELESWYFGDLAAVEKGLRISNLVRYSTKKNYRDPDAIDFPATELRRITNHAYQKVAGSRAIGPHMDADNNGSRSFRVFVDGILSMVGQ